jgi:hypothetical protein
MRWAWFECGMASHYKRSATKRIYCHSILRWKRMDAAGLYSLPSENRRGGRRHLLFHIANLIMRLWVKFWVRWVSHDEICDVQQNGIDIFTSWEGMNRLDLATTFLHSLLLGLRQKFNVFCCISQTHLFTLSERALIMRFSMCNKKNIVRNSELQNNNNINFKLIFF